MDAFKKPNYYNGAKIIVRKNRMMRANIVVQIKICHSDVSTRLSLE